MVLWNLRIKSCACEATVLKKLGQSSWLFRALLRFGPKQEAGVIESLKDGFSCSEFPQFLVFLINLNLIMLQTYLPSKCCSALWSQKKVSGLHIGTFLVYSWSKGGGKSLRENEHWAMSYSPFPNSEINIRNQWDRVVPFLGSTRSTVLFTAGGNSSPEPHHWFTDD